MTSRLELYNNSLTVHLGERRLASLSENREPRRALDDVYDGTLKYALGAAQWKFALRVQEVSSDPDFTQEFGFAYSFAKPEDYVRLAAICADEYFKSPLLDYADENGRWFADIDPVYVKYVSNDSAYGMDLSIWPESFALWVESALALRICKRLTASAADYESIKKESGRLLREAKNRDAMEGPTQFPPPGTWSSARRAGARRGDRIGSQLIG